MRNERKRFDPVKVNVDEQFGKLLLKISINEKFLHIAIEDIKIPDQLSQNNAEAKVFLLDDFAENVNTVYIQKRNYKFGLTQLEKRFCFKMGEEEAKLKKLIVLVNMKNREFGVKINLNYVDFHQNVYHWYEFQHLDFDGYPKSTPIEILGKLFKFEAKDIDDIQLNTKEINHIKKMFNMMDPNGNGYVEQPEFEKYLVEHGINIDKERVGYLFSLIHSLNAEMDNEVSTNKGITLQDLLLYYSNKSKYEDDSENEDDNDKEKKRRISLMVWSNNDELDKIDGVDNEQDELKLKHLKQDDEFFKDAMFQLLRRKSVDEVDLQKVADERWKGFANFERKSECGKKIIMKGEKGIVGDILPGNYTLEELSLTSSENNEEIKIVPHLSMPIKALASSGNGKAATVSAKFTEISGIKLRENPRQIILPDDFDGRIQIDVASSANVGYYGAKITSHCSTIQSDQDLDTIFIEIRHAIQDFSYDSDYFNEWVLDGAGGPGLEYHEFDHIDMPLQQDSGYFVLGKFANKEKTVLHVTAFKVGEFCTIFTPGGVLHTNNYQKGTWRIMLSEGPVSEYKLIRRGQPCGFDIL